MSTKTKSRTKSDVQAPASDHDNLPWPAFRSDDNDLDQRRETRALLTPFRSKVLEFLEGLEQAGLITDIDFSYFENSGAGMFDDCIDFDFRAVGPNMELVPMVRLTLSRTGSTL